MLRGRREHQPQDIQAMKDITFWDSDMAGGPFVRVAELEIDPARLGDFKLAIRESVQASIRSEAGVLALYAVSAPDNPSQITVIELYRSEAAYNSHRETPHFKRFFDTTREMVKSRKLLDKQPLVLGVKMDWADGGSF
jgi:quinol monooxygenase YgiN